MDMAISIYHDNGHQNARQVAPIYAIMMKINQCINIRSALMPLQRI